MYIVRAKGRPDRDSQSPRRAKSSDDRHAVTEVICAQVHHRQRRDIFDAINWVSRKLEHSAHYACVLRVIYEIKN